MSGYLPHGLWQTGWYDTRSTGVEFVRHESAFRHQVTADSFGGFKVERGRYHLHVFVGLPVGPSHTYLRKLKGLEEIVSVSVVDPVMAEQGWVFSDGPGCIPDTADGFRFLHQVYTAADPDYGGRVTVPVLRDKRTHKIVNNESAEIIRMFGSAFDALTSVKTDYYPSQLRQRIDEINLIVFERMNNGVYRCGFAGSQATYDRAFDTLLSALDQLDDKLGQSPYLVGDALTEADPGAF